MKKLELMYRCGGNYKYHFEMEVTEQILKQQSITVGSEVEIEKLGMTANEMYNHVGAEYDPDLDHNLVDVIAIKDVETPVPAS